MDENRSRRPELSFHEGCSDARLERTSTNDAAVTTPRYPRRRAGDAAAKALFPRPFVKDLNGGRRQRLIQPR